MEGYREKRKACAARKPGEKTLRVETSGGNVYKNLTDTEAIAEMGRATLHEVGNTNKMKVWFDFDKMRDGEGDRAGEEKRLCAQMAKLAFVSYAAAGGWSGDCLLNLAETVLDRAAERAEISPCYVCECKQCEKISLPDVDIYTSSGVNTASVHNTSSDLVTNDIPSTFLIPSLHPSLNKPENQFHEGDFVFALNPRFSSYPHCSSFEMDYRSAFNGTATIVTLPQLNAILQGFAKAHIDENTNAGEPWFSKPTCVREWARPLGVVLNKMRVNTGRHMQNNTPHYGLNISVSRRANVKNNFMAKQEHGRDWFGQSTMQVAVQYSCEKFRTQSGNTSIVLVSMILADSSLSKCTHRDVMLVTCEGAR